MQINLFYGCFVMIGWLLHLIFNGLTIERRNNYPRQESIVEIEHLALVLHYLTILYYFLPNSNVNLLKLYRYIFWKSFFTFIYSDINSFVKEQIKQRQYSIYQQLEDLVYQFLTSINLPDSLVLDVKKIYKQLLTDDEEKLLKLAKLLTVKKEIEVNSKIYPSVYKDAVKNITQKLNNIDIFLRPEEIEKINFYMDQVKRLKFSYRWNRLKKYYHISVLAHLFIVFSIAYFIGRLKNFSDKDMLELLSRALFHDIPEALTGDIVSPTKKAVPGLEDLIGDIEKDLVNNTLLKDFDFQIKEKLSKWMLNPFDGQIGKYVKYADLFSAMWEAKLENEEYFKQVYKNLKRNFLNIEDEAVQYLLKFGDEYFMDNVEQVWQQFLEKAK